MFQKRPLCTNRDAKLQMVRYYRVCNVSAIADLVFALLAGGPFRVSLIPVKEFAVFLLKSSTVSSCSAHSSTKRRPYK